MERFNDQMQAVASWAQGEFSGRLDPSPMGSAVSAIVNQIRDDGSIDAKMMSSKVVEIQSACVDYCAAAVFDIHEEANRRIKDILQNVFSEINEEFQKIQIVPDVTRSPEFTLATNLHVTSSWTSDIQRGVMGWGLGGSLGYTAATLTSILFPPAAAVAGFVSLVGAIAGGYSARKEYKQQQKEQAINQLQQHLANIIQKSREQGIRQFMDNLSSVRVRIRDLSREQVENNKHSMEERMLEIETTRKQTTEEARKGAAEAEARLKQIDSFLKGIDKLCADPADKSGAAKPSPVTR